ARRWIRRAGRYGAAASFVFREFDGAIKVAPSRAEIRWLQAAHPGTCLQTFIKRGASRGREMKWLGSYRYATVNIGGRDREDLFPCCDRVCGHLALAPPPRPVFAGTLDGLRPARVALLAGSGRGRR